ncbi:MAG: Gfo/Idh/MocA family oxidoreductase [Verrucomicrobia bacterium]|nr:Gfo/Idh/MocA family oxidoreductase [Verrucomicrobiota bacterium]
MTTHQQANHSASVSRREFLRNSSLATAGAVAAASFPAILHAQAKPPINAVVIGMGGRGGGAGRNFLDAAKAVGVEGKILAVADIFPDRARRGTDAFGVPEDKCFIGFDAYQKALQVPGVNYAIMATPPGFRPAYFKACIDTGKHVFMEKPVAVDGPGCRIMYAAGQLADQKGLKVAAGTQRRHQAGYVDTIKRLQDGAIGDIVTLRAYWVNGGPIWHRGERGSTALEKQIYNWYHYIWLCGDHICEQHVHNLDVCNWIMNDHPARCWGLGARQQLGDQSGEIWDNFAIEYEYASGVRMYSYCGQIKRGWSSVSEAVHGTNGVSNPSGEIRAKGAARWRSSLRLQSGDPYTQEHIALINAIVNGTELNETKNVTDSTLTAIMGREAAYSGNGLDWDSVLNSTFEYGPAEVYRNPAAMTYGEFRTLKPPMPSQFDILKTPPVLGS